MDKAFFRQSYDYRRAILQFSEISQKALSGQALIAEFSGSIETILPLERLAVVVDEVGPGGHRPLYSRGLRVGEDPSGFLGLPSGRIWARQRRDPDRRRDGIFPG